MLNRPLHKQWKKLPFYAMVFSLPFKLIYAPIFLVIQLLTALLSFNTKPKIKSSSFFPILLFCWFGLSLLYSSDLNNGISNLFMKLPLLFIPIVLSTLDYKVQTNKLYKTYVFSCFVFCVLAFIKLFYFTINSGISISDYNFVQRSIMFYHFPTEVLMLNIALVLNINLRIRNKLKLIYLMAIFTFIILSGTRVGILLSVPLFFINLYYITKGLGKLKKVFLFLALPLLITLAASQSRYTKNKILDSFHYIGLFTSIKTETGSKEYHRIDFRQKLWKASLFKIKESPIFGYGLGREKQIVSEGLSNDQNENNMLFNAHNQFLSTYLTSGIIGFINLVAWLLFVLYRGAKMKSFDTIAIALIVILSMFVESYFERQKGVFLIVLFLELISNVSPNRAMK